MSLLKLAEALGVPPIPDGAESSHAELDGLGVVYNVFHYGEELELYANPGTHWMQESEDVTLTSSDKALMVGGPFTGNAMQPLASLAELRRVWPEKTLPGARLMVMEALGIISH